MVKIIFDDEKSTAHNSFSGTVNVITFGSEQYQWHPDDKWGKADPNGPAARSTVTASPETAFTLEKASVTVLRGMIGPAQGAVKRKK